MIVQVLWAQGCHVTATDAHAGGSVLGLDVTGPGAVEAFISDVERMHPVEVFVDAAGVFHTVDGGASMIR